MRKSASIPPQGRKLQLALAAMLFWIAGCDSDRSHVPAEPHATEASDHSETQPVAEQAIRFEGRVVSITDGDTIDVLVGRREVTVRLAEIDAPERTQPWGARSRQVLSELVGNRTVQIAQTDTDGWGRVVGRVFSDGEDVNLQMVRLGAAWAFLRYQTDPHFSEVEAEARRLGRGLWGMRSNEIIAPWDWRAGVRVQQLDGAPQIQSRQGLLPDHAGGSEFLCGQRRYCSQMRSCEEARFHLTQCGVTTIDGDGDGTPCERLCRSD